MNTLTARGEPVRVVVRDGPRARAALGAHVEVRVGDVRQREGLEAILEGSSAVVSAFHGLLGGRRAGPQEVDATGNRHPVDAANQAGAGVVLVSVVGAAADSRVELARAKHAAEVQLRASTTAWTIVRSGPLLETWLAILSRTAGASGRPLVFGRRDQRLPFVTAADVAYVVSRAALDATWRAGPGGGRAGAHHDRARARPAGVPWLAGRSPARAPPGAAGAWPPGQARRPGVRPV